MSSMWNNKVTICTNAHRVKYAASWVLRLNKCVNSDTELATYAMTHASKLRQTQRYLLEKAYRSCIGQTCPGGMM